jgi:Tfp pilus assembly protein PilE
MYNKNQQLKAFTIMEVTITMLIAVIVIGITYTAYTIVNKSFLNYKSKNEDIALLARIDHLIRRDFEQATIVEGDQTGINIIKSGQPSIHYEITPGYILRKATVTDTFKVNSSDVKAYFEGTDRQYDRIDELTFTIHDQDDLIPYHYFKQYSSANLIQPSPNAIN